MPTVIIAPPARISWIWFKAFPEALNITLSIAEMWKKTETFI